MSAPFEHDVHASLAVFDVFVFVIPERRRRNPQRVIRERVPYVRDLRKVSID